MECSHQGNQCEARTLLPSTRAALQGTSKDRQRAVFWGRVLGRRVESLPAGCQYVRQQGGARLSQKIRTGKGQSLKLEGDGGGRGRDWPGVRGQGGIL